MVGTFLEPSPEARHGACRRAGCGGAGPRTLHTVRDDGLEDVSVRTCLIPAEDVGEPPLLCLLCPGAWFQGQRGISL